MPALRIRKTVTVEAPIDRVYAAIRDFRQWPSWSPWLICEPEARLTFAEDGRSYEWEGQIVGSGRIEIDQERAPESISMRLSFLKPFKSRSSAGFVLRALPGGQGTEVEWSMDGSLQTGVRGARLVSWRPLCRNSCAHQN